jgi:DNA-binding NarL/FixJ family response regulator
MTSSYITVALVEDEPETHARLLVALSSDTTIDVVFATSAAKPMLQWLVSKMGESSPSVLLVDLGLPDHSGLEVIRLCKAMHPKTEIMVITMFGDEANMIRAFEAGASGYLLKDGTESELSEHVRTLHGGGSPMSPIIARQLLTRMGSVSKLAPQALPPMSASQLPLPMKPDSGGLLTEREEQVLQLLSRGYSYGELAKEMGVTINTIQTHIRGLYAKLEVHSKSQAVFQARQRGFLEK